MKYFTRTISSNHDAKNLHNEITKQLFLYVLEHSLTTVIKQSNNHEANEKQPQKFQSYKINHKKVFGAMMHPMSFYVVCQLTLIRYVYTHIIMYQQKWYSQARFSQRANKRETTSHHIQCRLYYSNTRCKQPVNHACI